MHRGMCAKFVPRQVVLLLYARVVFASKQGNQPSTITFTMLQNSIDLSGSAWLFSATQFCARCSSLSREMQSKMHCINIAKNHRLNGVENVNAMPTWERCARARIRTVLAMWLAGFTRPKWIGMKPIEINFAYEYLELGLLANGRHERVSKAEL